MGKGAGAARLALLLALSALLALAFFSFERKLDSFRSIPGDYQVRRGEITVRSGAGALLPGDRILLIDGTPVASIAEPLRTLAHRPLPHRLAVLRGGRIQEVAAPRPRVRIDGRYLLLCGIGGFALLVGLLTLSRDRGAAALLFAAYSACWFGITWLTPAGPLDEWWKAFWLAEDVLRAVSPALLLHFLLVFGRKSPGRRAALLYLPGALLMAGDFAISSGALSGTPRLLPGAQELLERGLMLYLALYSAAAIVMLARMTRQAADVALRQQARWIALGCACGLAPFLVLYALPRAFGTAPGGIVSAAAVVPLALVPAGFAYAILRWRLWDLDFFAREAAATASAVILGAACFALVDLLLTRVFDAAASGVRNLFAYGAGILLATMLVPVRRRLSEAIERFQFGETYRARRALLEFARKWRGSADEAEIARALTQAVRDALAPSPCRVLLFSTGDGLAEPIAERLSASDQASIRSSTFPSGEDVVFLGLFEDGYRHLFALRANAALVGVLAVGDKDGRVPLSSEDRALLTTVAAQASLALENAELYRRLEQRATESAEKERLAALGALAAGVAHEVNTPLAGISSYAQMLLADTDAADPRYGILKKMERQTFRASHLIRDLLELARGRHAPASPMDLSETLRNALESCEPHLAARRIRVEQEGTDRPMPMHGNAAELEQVFVNLLMNARDASPEGSAVSLRARAEDASWRVEIEDRGAGVSEETARRAFEPFFTTRPGAGTGLGLAIAREVVKRHQGEISLAPRADGGAVATVRLPR